MINNNSPLPLYLQLANIIEQRILSREFKIGEKLPSENQLSKEYNIARPTVRQALEYLKNRGLITKKKGLGTFVRDYRKNEISLFSFSGVSEAFKQKGVKFEKELIEKLVLKKIVTEVNNPFFERFAYYFSRLDIVEDKPLIFERFFLDCEIFRGLEKYNLKNLALSEIVEKEFYLKPTKIKQIFKAILPDSNLCRLIKVQKTSPILLVKRHFYFGKEQGAIYSEVYLNTINYDYYQEIFELNSGG